MASLSGSDIRTRVTTLQRLWGTRDKKMKEWYNQIQMLDSLAQANMESFVGNDPRAAFNLVGSLLNQKIPHRLPAESIGVEQVQSAAELSHLFDLMWNEVFDAYRQRGREFMDDFIGYLLCTGWYSVFAGMTLDGSAAIADIWNPATVYPAYGEGLDECAHIFTPGATSVKRLAARNGWKLDSTPSDNTVIYDYWWTEFLQMRTVVHNAILVENTLVKLDTVETRFTRIPIFVAPVGGLPDTGVLSPSSWRKEIGQSFIATNENIYKQSNKWWTFVMQLLRDTAQARTFERTSNPQQIVKPETWYRRGAHYKLGPNDEVGFIQPPTIPVELRSSQLDMEAMMERGGYNWAMSGSIQERMTAYGMSQIAASTHRASRPYHKGIINCITDIDNFWYGLMADNNYKPYGVGLPKDLPENVKLTADYELRIPGDMVQRATTARMLNPNFELSDEYIMAQMFPEIKNPAEELARIRASQARKNPIYAQISLTEALRQEAIILRSAGDTNGATLYEKAADRLEQAIVGEPQPERQPQGQLAPGVRPEVRPPQELGALEGGER